jgi:adenylyltransferase/sulfurtransferase
MPQSPASLTSDRYVRQLSLPGFGPAAQASLARARVLVIGAGGLGSSVLPVLAAAGVGSAAAGSDAAVAAHGTIGIVDDDLVELSNLHRQYIHGTADVGRPKVASAADALAALNPETRVTVHNQRLTAANALDLFAGYDLVIDGSDNFPTRYLANDAAALTGIPLVWGAVSQYAGQAGVAWAARGPQYRDLFPSPPPAGSVLSCADGGVLPSVCAVIGAILATETLKILTGIGDPLVGRVTTFDALTGGFRELEYGPDPSAPPITELIDYDLFCGVGRSGDGTDVATGADGADGDEGGRGDGISADELAAQLGSRTIVLLDVREPWEVAVATLPGAVQVPLGSLETALRRDSADLGYTNIAGITSGTELVVYCHHGIRSAVALATLNHAGFTAARHLEGGIDAWSRRIDPSLARY